MVSLFEYRATKTSDLHLIPAISTRDAYEWAKNHFITELCASFSAFRRKVKLVANYPDSDAFDAKYELLRNHLVSDAPWEGCMFETFGTEEDHIFEACAKHVWTILDIDSLTWVAAGRHWVNRMGYLISLTPWKDHREEYLIG